MQGTCTVKKRRGKKSGNFMKKEKEKKKKKRGKVRAVCFVRSRVMASPSVLIEFCRNCDGGEQERDTAQEAVLKACPEAKIEVRRLDEHPVFVRITVDGEVVWEKAQRNLFRKYPDLREQSQKEIAALFKPKNKM